MAGDQGCSFLVVRASILDEDAATRFGGVGVSLYVSA